MIQKVKGFRDIFGADIPYWHYIEEKLHKLFMTYGFKEFRLPVLEKTAVFKRGIGETTDIVEKEMFTFIDSEESVSLRPEGTASLMRAYIENNLHHTPGVKKYYYLGNMFRRERPQKGRFRQFTQIGVEVLECDAPLLDAEVISLLYKMAEVLGLTDYVKMEINSIGCPNCRPDYRKALVDYFSQYYDNLCDDCKRRINTNPLRILDCKNEKCKSYSVSAPKISEYLCSDCNNHFDEVKHYLDMNKVPYVINDYMVRGLDYYIRTAFELVTDKLGSASAVGAGGRYDGLVKNLGGKDTAGIGFAIGIDRVVELLKEVNPVNEKFADVYMISFDNQGLSYVLEKTKELRDMGFIVEYDYNQSSMKSQMKKADKSGALYAVIFGENELKEDSVSVRELKTEEGRQELVKISDLKEYLSNKI